MGWSERTSKPKIDKIFKELKLKYAMRRVLTPNPTVQIEHQKELDVPTMKAIVELFPDFVYVEFISDANFSESNAGDNFIPR